MFENPRRGRRARNFTANVLKILDLKYFPKIDVGCPCYASQLDITEKDLSCLKATPKADISSPKI